MRQLTITKKITQRTDNSTGRYLAEISKYPLISAEEEVMLTIRIREGDTEALDKLVVSNLRFVISVAKQYQNQGLTFSDLINEGNYGLVKAARKYDETRGFKFISYAVWWIRQAIIQAISEQTRVVRLPLNRLSSINKIKKAIPHLEQELEREPTDAEIAEYLEFKHEDVKIANAIKHIQISLDGPITQNGDHDSKLIDFIQSSDTSYPDSQVLKDSVQKNINWALSQLSNREAAIIKMSFGLSGVQYATLGAIAEEFNLTSERARQIRNTGLNKLKQILKGKAAYFEP